VSKNLRLCGLSTVAKSPAAPFACIDPGRATWPSVPFAIAWSPNR
jgi:hypothetical protein